MTDALLGGIVGVGLGVAATILWTRRSARSILQETKVEATTEPGPEVEGLTQARAQLDELQNIVSKARQVLLTEIERTAGSVTAEATATTVPLATEDLKGRLIGRDGRNIKAFEDAARVDLIVNEQPSHVTLSSFDPVRREVARLALIELLSDGKIYPARIEECLARASNQVHNNQQRDGSEAAKEAGVRGLPPAVLRQMGALKYRTGMGQNVLAHSVESAQIASRIARALQLDHEAAACAAFLHDIGKGIEGEITHAIAGMDFLKKQGLPETICNGVGAHHREIPLESPEAQIVIIADSISASRPGARRESLDKFMSRLSDLEELATQFPGVEAAYATQAGRELNVVVRPESVDDSGAQTLAQEIASVIEARMQYPGQIRVTVIREIRAHGTAK